MIILENQLIVYRPPKKSITKIILLILLGLLLSIIIFAFTVFSSTIICLKNKSSKVDTTNLVTTDLIQKTQ